MSMSEQEKQKYICTSNFSVKDKYHNNTFEKEWKQMIRPVTVKINNII